MKRKRLTYDSWEEITEKRLTTMQAFDPPLFRGIAARLDMLSVTAPQVWTLLGSKKVICDSGYHWLILLSADEHYCITSMLNRKGESLVWYIDMIDGQGIDPDGVPYFDDLYLDLVVHVDGTINVADMDELEWALKKGDITRRQFDLANETAKHLKRGLLKDVRVLKQLTAKYDAILEDMAVRKEV